MARLEAALGRVGEAGDVSLGPYVVAAAAALKDDEDLGRAFRGLCSAFGVTWDLLGEDDATLGTSLRSALGPGGLSLLASAEGGLDAAPAPEWAAACVEINH